MSSLAGRQARLRPGHQRTVEATARLRPAGYVDVRRSADARTTIGAYARRMSDARATAERRWWPPSSPDAFVVLIAGLVQVGGTALAARHQTPVRDLDPGGYALLAAGVLLLVFRRAAPVAVLAGVFV